MERDILTELVARSVFGDPRIKLTGFREISTPGSTVYRLAYDQVGAPAVLYAKIPGRGKNSIQTERAIARLRREFELAKQVESLFESSPELRVVSPAAYIDEINACVTWEVLGTPMQDMISRKLRFRFFKAPSDLCRMADLTGQWLRRFHNLALIENNCETQFDTEISDYCRGRLDALVGHRDSHVSQSFADAVMDRVSDWIGTVRSSETAPIVICHNDYSPHNIIVTDTGICVLDFSYSGIGLPAFDVACFWHKIEDLKQSPLQRAGPFANIQKAFLDGYGTDTELTDPAFKLGVMRLTLSKMLTLLNTAAERIDRKLENKRRYAEYFSALQSEL